MRVLMVSDVYFPRVNGVSTSIETFRATLGAEGVEVRLLAPRYADEADQPGIVRVAARSRAGRS
jgi:1,2-diacylglycerol 3-alpha-glucosyltransferase